MAQITCKMIKLKVTSKVQIKLLTTTSRSTSQIPRVNKNLNNLGFDFLEPYKKEDDPAKNTNTGAQKCVMNRVKNNMGVVVSKSVGSVKKEPK